MSDTKRVTMVWPEDLKDEVRDKVGQRGLTEFTLEAVRNHLKVSDHQRDLEKEVNELKYLCQLLADRVAMGGDYQDRENDLREVDLPHWISTDGWPDFLAALVKPELATHTEVVLAEVAEVIGALPDELEPIAIIEEPKIEASPAPSEPPPRSSELPHDRGAGDDFLAKVMGAAAQKGVDLGDVPLKKASDIVKPESKPEPVVELEPEPVEPKPEPVEPEIDPNACRKCGDELVAGECWSCL